MIEFRYALACAAQIFINSLAGGLAFALVGGLCGAGAAFFVELLCGGWGEGVFIGVPVGAFVGIACGVAGIFIHLFSAFGSEPDEFWRPWLDLTPRVARGQGWGTLSACAAFLVLVLMSSISSATSFVDSAKQSAILFAVGAPAFMVFGAIVAAVMGRD